MTQDEIISIRTPKPNYPVFPAIAMRFSPRIFSNESVPERDIATFMEAARLAPSARFNQPWNYYITVKGTMSFEKLLTCIPERNHWCAKAPILIITAYSPAEPIDGVNKWAQYDLGAANMALILQAQDLGYYTRQIGSLDASKIKEIFADVIKDPYLPFVVLAIGKLGNNQDYADESSEYVIKDKTPPGRREKIFEILP
jgi:nitroreductase